MSLTINNSLKLSEFPMFTIFVLPTVSLCRFIINLYTLKWAVPGSLQEETTPHFLCRSRGKKESQGGVGGSSAKEAAPRPYRKEEMRRREAPASTRLEV